MSKKLTGLPVNSDPGQEPTSASSSSPPYQTTSFQIKKTIDTWVEVSPLNQWSCHHHIPVGLDSYSMVDLISISFIKLFGLSPCMNKKHQHVVPALEGVGQMHPQTYGFFHLKITITDCFNCSLSFIWPFLAVDQGPQDSQVLLGRPT